MHIFIYALHPSRQKKKSRRRVTRNAFGIWDAHRGTIEVSQYCQHSVYLVDCFKIIIQNSILNLLISQNITLILAKFLEGIKVAIHAHIILKNGSENTPSLQGAKHQEWYLFF